MEAAASVAVAARGVSMTMPSSQSQSSRKEWRVVSDHPVQNVGNEDLDRSKLGQGDERLIYEVQQGREPVDVDVDFFPIAVDGSSDHELRLDNVVKQREQLQHLEINIKARLIARSEVMEMQDRFDSQIKEHIAANVKLQEQLHDREKTIHDLQRTLEDKDKELHAIRLDHEAAWAKEDLLREQNKELASFRRERDNSEAERAQHIKQIHDLQEHIQEKDRQFMELQEQHRVAQDNIAFKDEQIREAQAWMARIQEMDALHSTTNHSLQAELRERTEQYNQLWLGCQRQFAEMERLHLHTIQQLQHELTEARERSGTYSDELRVAQTNLKDASHLGNSNGSQLEATGGSTLAGNSGGLQNGNVDIISSFAATGSGSTQSDQLLPVQMAPQSVHGMPPYLPPGQLTALHPLVMHQQGIPQNVNSHIDQSHLGQFHSLPVNSSLSHWQNQQVLSDGSQMPNHEQYASQNDQNSSRQGSNYDYEVPVKAEAVGANYLDVHVSQGLESHSVVPSPNREGQVLEAVDNGHLVNTQSQQSLQQISAQFHSTLRLNPSDHDNEHQEINANTFSNHEDEPLGSTTENLTSVINASEVILPAKFSETTMNKGAGATAPEGFVSTGQKSSMSVGKTADPALLDEESLLACVVRTVPPGPGGKIRISTTLTNRLGKMIAPLHWSDYKKKYGKLDDFLGSHPELFLIDGDLIKVREGAQEIIAAMAARAKVRAAAVAAAATSSHSSLVPSVAVTPMAQPRLKKASSINSSSVKAEKSMFNESQLLAVRNQHPNGVPFHTVGSISSVRILSKQNDQMELNGPETRSSQSSVILPNGNGTNLSRTDLGSSQSRVLNHGRPSPNFAGKQLGRSGGAMLNSRR